MYIILLGPPGAGKGTQSRRLAQEYNLKIISTGDIFREEIRKESELGKKVKKYLEAGLLVPDHIVIELVKSIIRYPECSLGVIFDGFPRTIKQAEELDRLLSNCNRKVDIAINIEISDEDVIKRNTYRRVCINCGRVYHLIFDPPKTSDICDFCGGKLIQRKDDKEDVIRKRLEVYRQWTRPIIQYYSEKSILVNIDGTKNIDEVYNQIKTVIEKRVKKLRSHNPPD